MLKVDRAFSGFSVNDLDVAREFYGQTLGLPIEESPAGIRLKIGNGILVYPKQDHQPSTYTMLNFPVDKIDEAVDELRKGSGTQFDPALVDAFVAALRRDGWQLPAPPAAPLDHEIVTAQDHDDPTAPLRVVETF